MQMPLAVVSRTRRMTEQSLFELILRDKYINRGNRETVCCICSGKWKKKKNVKRLLGNALELVSFSWLLSSMFCDGCCLLSIISVWIAIYGIQYERVTFVIDSWTGISSVTHGQMHPSKKKHENHTSFYSLLLFFRLCPFLFSTVFLRFTERNEETRTQYRTSIWIHSILPSQARTSGSLA